MYNGFGWDALGESPCASIADDDGGSAFGHRSPLGVIIIEPNPPLYGVLWVKAMSSSWTSDGSATGIMTSLEASFLEAQLSLWNFSYIGGQGW